VESISFESSGFLCQKRRVPSSHNRPHRRDARGWEAIITFRDYGSGWFRTATASGAFSAEGSASHFAPGVGTSRRRGRLASVNQARRRGKRISRRRVADGRRVRASLRARGSHAFRCVSMNGVRRVARDGSLQQTCLADGSGSTTATCAWSGEPAWVTGSDRCGRPRAMGALHAPIALSAVLQSYINDAI